jgi:epoxyqueuosine reductase
MTEHLLRWAESRGYRVAWGPVTMFDVARNELERRRDEGEIEEDFFRENLQFDQAPLLFRTARDRILVVAMPRPAHSVEFTVGSQSLRAVLPPTYLHYRSTFEDVRRDLAVNALSSWQVRQIEGPLKSLASRLGLVRYGRNNLTYAPGIGSYLQLLGYLTDAPLPIDAGWTPHEPSLLDECEACRICQALCPTGAVSEERVLLHAQRCLTLANESPGTWPSWVSPAVHHCLLGCLLCQRQCPANPDLPVEATGVTFDDEETRALLAGGQHNGQIWDRIRQKFERLGQPYQEAVIGRNLQGLLDARRIRTNT